jgi:hypothetical protein
MSPVDGLGTYFGIMHNFEVLQHSLRVMARVAQ